MTSALAPAFRALAMLLLALASAVANGADAFRDLRAQATQGDAQAQYDLGVALLCGARGRREAEAEAARWIGSAAEQQHRGAQSLFGWLHMVGRGVPADDAQAARWLTPAAQGGDTAAQNNLGVLYAAGRGVAHDHARAARWFRAAADQGAEDAVRNLDVLENGDPVPADRPLRQTAAHPALAAASCALTRPVQ